jgi:hypothetical protein
VIKALQKHIQGVLPLAGIGAKTAKKDANLQITFMPKGSKIKLGKNPSQSPGLGVRSSANRKRGKFTSPR